MKPSINESYASKGMRYPAINDLISKASNKYELVLATAKRAREIIDGDEPLVKITIDNSVSIATMEIAEDMVRPISHLHAQEEVIEVEETRFPEDEPTEGMTTAELAEEAEPAGE